MKPSETKCNIRSVRAMFALLTSFWMFLAPLTPVALGARRTPVRAESSTTAAKTQVSHEAPLQEHASTAAQPSAAPEPLLLQGGSPSITATKTDNITAGTQKLPGDTITYDVTITNNGTGPANNVVFNDTPDPNTTLVPGSVNTQPIAINDTASAIGNVAISTANGAPNLLANDRDPDTGNNSGLTASGPTTSANGGNVTVSSNGDFTYNPAPGYTGTDDFTYTITDPSGKTDTAKMTITVGPTLVWFINNTPGACSSGCDGRLNKPFPSIAAFNAGAADDPGDIIFIYTGSTNYSGNITLLNNQKLIGQGFLLQTETGTPPAGSDPLPGAGASPTIDNAGSTIITLGQNNTIRGLNTGNSGAAGTDIAGTSFSTLTMSAVTIGGDGRALNLTTGTLAATVAGISASNTGTNAGLVLNGVGGSLTVSGATNIQNPGGTGIDVTNAPASASFSFGTTTVNKNSTAGIGVNLTASSPTTATTSFSSLTVTTSNGVGVNTNNVGTVTVSGGSIGSTSGAAASLTNSALNMAFTSVSSDGGVNGILISGGSGGFASGTTSLLNSTAIGLSMSSSAVAADFGSTTVNSSAGAGINLLNNSGNVTFSALNIAPDANQRGIDAQGNSGTLTVTSGAITTSGNANASAVFIDGPAGRTPINLTFTSITTSNATNSINLADVSGTKFQVTGTTQINTRSGTGIFVDNATTTNIQFATVNIPNPNAAGGYGIRVEDSSSAVTVATATISNAEQTVTQNDANSDFIPDNDGDGDAIFLTTNTGSFTLNGGTLSNCDSDCIDVRDTSNLVLSGVTITSPGTEANGSLGSGTGGHGIQAISLKGTSSLTNTNISGFTVAGRDGVRLINTGSSTLTITLDNTTISNASGGSNGLYISGRDSSVVNTTVKNSTFSGLDGAAITHNAGDNAGSTATSNLTIQNSIFQNAKAPVAGSGGSSGGLNTVSAQTFEAGKASITITGSTFDNVARTASSNTGVITINGNGLLAGDSLAVNISGNTIKNIGDATANSCGAAQCIAYRGIQVFVDDKTHVTGTIVIDSNVLTNIQRDGILLDLANDASGNDVNMKVTNNKVGVRADGVTIDRVGLSGQSGMRIFRRRAGGRKGNVLVSGNIIRNGSGAAASALNGPGIFVRAEDDAILDLTAFSNNIETNSSGPVEFRADTNFPNPGGTSVMCLDFSGNTLAAGAGGININETTGTMNVEQASASALATANGIPAGNVSVTGSPTFGVACATPPAAPADGVGAGPTGDEGNGGGDAPSLSQNAPATVAPVADAEIELAAYAPANRLRDAQTTSRASARRDDEAVYFGALGKASKREVSYRAANYSPMEGDAVYTRGRSLSEETAKPVAAQTKRQTKATAATVSAPLVQAGSVSVNIGTLNAGDSVTITFQVTINNNTTASQVCNQGTVSGSNFSNVQTDDPETPTASDATCTSVQPPPDVSIKDASAAEPASGTNTMPFVVTLSRASSLTVTVHYTTADDTTGAHPATAGSDYTTTTNTLTFLPGQTVQTISVPVLSDGDTSETDETFLVNLDSPTNANSGDMQAVGTITTNNPAGALLISEVRTSGPGTAGTGDANDDFVEIYNNSDLPVTVSTSDGSTGWALVKMAPGNCTATPIVVGVIPNGTTIQEHGHYLFGGTGYSLTGYASVDQTMTANLEDDANVALFNTSNLLNLATGTRLDAVGFGSNTGNNCDLLREGTNLAAASGSTSQYSFVRKLDSGVPQDTNANDADFIVVSTTPATPVGNNASPILGAPGPENMSSPVMRNHPLITSQLLDPLACSTCAPNRVRDSSVAAQGPNAAQGTLTIRRTFVNNTGGNVTRLRWRIINMTTVNSPNVFGGLTQADLRALNSSDGSVAVTGGSILVRGTTIDTPPTQPNGGGVNSSYSLTNTGVVSLAQPLAQGGSVSVQFVLGVQSGGKFNFFINIDALPQ